MGAGEADDFECGEEEGVGKKEGKGGWEREVCDCSFCRQRARKQVQWPE